MRKFLFGVLALTYAVIAIGRQTAPQVQTFGVPAADSGGIWNSALASRTGVTMSSTTNEFGTIAECMMQKTSGIVPYEKDCSVDWAVTVDPSTLPVTKDAVGRDTRCYIDGGIQTGRCWAFYGEAGVQPGSDGMPVGFELGMSNFGSDQPNINTATSKTLFSLIAGEHPGNKNITGFLRMKAGNAQSHLGIIGESSAFTDPNAPVFGVQSNATGQYTATMTADGRVTGSILPHFFNTNGLDPNLLPPGQIKPGEAFLWGDTSTFKSYLAFYNGGGILTVPLANYIPWTK